VKRGGIDKCGPLWEPRALAVSSAWRGTGETLLRSFGGFQVVTTRVPHLALGEVGESHGSCTYWAVLGLLQLAQKASKTCICIINCLGPPTMHSCTGYRGTGHRFAGAGRLDLIAQPVSRSRVCIASNLGECDQASEYVSGCPLCLLLK